MSRGLDYILEWPTESNVSKTLRSRDVLYMFDFLGCKLLIETKARMVLVGENFIIGFIQLLLKNYSGGGGVAF